MHSPGLEHSPFRHPPSQMAKSKYKLIMKLKLKIPYFSYVCHTAFPSTQDCSYNDMAPGSIHFYNLKKYSKIKDEFYNLQKEMEIKQRLEMSIKRLIFFLGGGLVNLNLQSG